MVISAVEKNKAERGGRGWAGGEVGRGRFVVVQSLSCVWLCVTPLTAARQASLSTTSWTLLKLTSMPTHHLILCRPLLLLPSVFPRVREEVAVLS